MNTHLNFNWEFGLYAVKTVHRDYNDKDSPIRKECPIELIKYSNSSKQSHYPIAWFRLDDEGYELHSVGGRLFEEISSAEIGEIWAQLQAAQKMLDAYFKASEASSEN